MGAGDAEDTSVRERYCRSAPGRDPVIATTCETRAVPGFVNNRRHPRSVGCRAQGEVAGFFWTTL
jgi:hypothetical protein